MKKCAVSTSWITARTRGNVSVGLSASAPFVLQKAVGKRRQDDMALPPRQRSSLEVIEADLVLEFLVLLFDGPALMGQRDQGAQRRRRRQIHQVIAGAVAAGQFPFAEQPDFRREPSVRSPVVRGRHPDGTEAGARGPDASRCATRRGAIGAVLASPPRRARRCCARRRQRGARPRAAFARQRCRRREGRRAHKDRRSDDTPNAYGRPARCKVRRSVALSPNSASPTTAVKVKPAARTWRSSVNASCHFGGIGPSPESGTGPLPGREPGLRQIQGRAQ